MIVEQRQPTKRSCGQTCVAMLRGVPAVDVINEISDRKGTSGKQLIEHLRAHGISTGDRPERYRGTLPAFAIVRVIWSGLRHRTHWMLWADGRFIDPDPHPTLAWNENGGRLMSFIEVAL